MFTALNIRNGLHLKAVEAEKDGSYVCTRCNEQVILKKGRVRVPHFAHATSSTCPYSGESERHLNTKIEIYNTLKANPSVEDIDMERNLTEARPDIIFSYRRSHHSIETVAIEVQVSKISRGDIDRRTRFYTEKNISILWIIPLSASRIRNGEIYRSADWERYLHGMYFGCIYYWLSGEFLLPVRFKPVSKMERWVDFDPIKTIKITSCRSCFRAEYKNIYPAAKLWKP